MTTTPIGCNTKYAADDAVPDHSAIDALNDMKMAQLPPERVQAMKDYAVKLHKANPHWKPSFVQRKVAQKFKITLIS